MKKSVFHVSLILVFAAELSALLLFAVRGEEMRQDPVVVNEVVQSVQRDWDRLADHENRTGLDYVVLDAEGRVRYRTAEHLRESIHDAVCHRDTMLTATVEGEPVGTVIIQNQETELLKSHRQRLALFFGLAVLVQAVICLGFDLYWNRVVLRPFEKLRGFARRVAQGNLDIPLQMDRQNLFGAFTESFDIMRSELRKARMAEAEANASKKELIAKLSHDIKTPVASIKAVAEVGAARTEEEKVRESYHQIMCKADQINTLITNLFTATLEELSQLSVVPAELSGSEVRTLLENADYLHRAQLEPLPPCLVMADKLRLQQVFDNLFANSYKYADTAITVTARLEEGSLAICLEDSGGGVSGEELPLLKEKFRRGSNSEGIEGAGLGLYVSNYFMEKMEGGLLLENGARGLRATVILKYI